MRLHQALLLWLIMLSGLPAAAGTGSPAASAAAGPPSPPGAVRWAAGNLPPFIWFGPNGTQGYCHDLVQLMSAKLGRPMDLTNYPWARAVRMARESDDVGIFPLLRTPEREPHFHWLIPLVRARHAFIGRPGGSIDLMDEQALRRERIGVLRGSPHVQMLRGKDFKLINEGMEYKDLLRMLNEGMVTAIYATEPLLRAAMDELGYKSREYVTGLSLGTGELYMATSLKLDAAEAERWLKAYRELQQDGSVARLQKKYLIEF